MGLFTIIGAAAVVVPVILGLSILLVMWKAWWLYPAWAWYLVPLGLPQITFWHFTALLFLLSTLTGHVSLKKDNRPTDWGAVVTLNLWPMIAWAILRWMR